MDNLYIVMPAYNEEDNICDVVKQWYPVLDGKGVNSRLVVADSGSSDKTHERLLEMQTSFDKLEILDNTGKQHGPKLIALYNYAIEQGADYIFQTDSDGQTNPDEFNAFWEARQQYDVILGNRTKRGDGQVRAFVEHVVCFILRCIFKVKVPDANAPYRVMKADVLKKYMFMFDEDYNLPNIMLTTFFSRFKEKMSFIEISFEPRKKGKNSINLIKIIKIGWKALRDFSAFRKQMEAFDEARK